MTAKRVFAETPRRTKILLGVSLVLVAMSLLLGMTSESAMASPSEVSSLMAEPSDEEMQLAAGDSPKEVWADSVANADISAAMDNWLTFDRWSEASGVPEQSTQIADATNGSIANGLIQSIASLLMGASLFLLMIVGAIMAFAFGIPFFDQINYQADKVYALIGRAFFSPTNGTWQYLIIPLVLLMLVTFALGMFRRSQKFGMAMAHGKSLSLTSVLILVALIVTTTQSAKNHEETGVGSSPIASSKKTSSDPGDWAFGSMGWVVTQTGQFIRLGTDHLGKLATTFKEVAGEATQGDGDSSDQCMDMVAGLHTIFRETAAYKNNRTAGDLLLQYDDFVSGVYFKSWMLAQGGNTASARNAWCHQAETLAAKSFGNRLLVLREAGLLVEVAGKGSLNPRHRSDASTRTGWVSVGSTDATGGNALVNKDGEWVNPVNAYFRAGALFGPTYTKADGDRSKDAAGSAKGFWAACYSPGAGRSMELHDDWHAVEPASYKKAPVREAVRDTIAEVIPDVLVPESLEDPVARTLWDVKGAGLCGAVLSQQDGLGSDIAKNNFRYAEGDGFLGTGFFADDMVSRFTAGGGRTESALQYYRASNGLETWSSFGYGITTAVSAYFILKFLGGLLIGGLFAQGLGSVMLLLLAGVLFIAIVPGTHRYIKEMCVMVLQANVVVMGLAILFSLLFLTTAVLHAVFGTLAGGSNFFQMIAYMLAVFLAFKSITTLIERYTRYNLSTFRGQVQAGFSSGSPIAQRLGLDTLSPLEFVQKPSNAGPQGAPVLRDDQNSANAANGTKFGASQAADKDILNDKRMKRASTLNKLDGLMKAGQVAGAAAPATGPAAPFVAGVGAAAAVGGKIVGAAKKSNDTAVSAKDSFQNSKVVNGVRRGEAAASAWTHDLLFNDQSKHAGTEAKNLRGQRDDALLGDLYSGQRQMALLRAGAARHNDGVDADSAKWVTQEVGGALLDSKTGEIVGEADLQTGAPRFFDPKSGATSLIVDSEGVRIRDTAPRGSAAPRDARADRNVSASDPRHSQPREDTQRVVEAIAASIPAIFSRVADESIPLIGKVIDSATVTSSIPGTLPDANAQAVSSVAEAGEMMSRFLSVGEQTLMRAGSGNEVMDMASVAWNLDRDSNLFADSQSFAAIPQRDYSGMINDGWAAFGVDHEVAQIIGALTNFGSGMSESLRSNAEMIADAQLRNDHLVSTVFAGAVQSVEESAALRTSVITRGLEDALRSGEGNAWIAQREIDSLKDAREEMTRSEAFRTQDLADEMTEVIESISRRSGLATNDLIMGLGSDVTEQEPNVERLLRWMRDR